ncbi:uncharacterized protein AB675_10864 [Cyphellophora attinorum]|uniref:Uncharacterized protein n=1 Tax=Cyphellophora attinorum TaxID=1664694 RepID=A0A0N1H5D1_9EURO|nr:uncharacterized protein AB675_10864 [Phialophora attinorum]KPI40855.1 hypothetical protein AB675_10864 [Phialophora attinorum]
MPNKPPAKDPPPELDAPPELDTPPELDGRALPSVSEIMRDIKFDSHRNSTIQANTRSIGGTNTWHDSLSGWIHRGGWVVLVAGICLLPVIAYLLCKKSGAPRRARGDATRALAEDPEILTRRLNPRRERGTMSEVSGSSNNNNIWVGSSSNSINNTTWTAPPAYNEQHGWEIVGFSGMGGGLTKPDPVAPKYVNGGKSTGGLS